MIKIQIAYPILLDNRLTPVDGEAIESAIRQALPAAI